MDLYDAVTWQNLLPFTGPVMGYIDGAVSAWPPEAWPHFAGRTVLPITVLADQRAVVFDSEAGNASQEQVAAAVANRLQSRQWSTVYTAQDSLPALTQALRGKGLQWRDAQYWPAPGIYLHVADPSGNIRAGRWHPPVDPVAVQDRWMGGYDVSYCYGDYPVGGGGPAPGNGGNVNTFPVKCTLVTAPVWSPNGARFDVMALGEDGHVYHYTWDAVHNQVLIQDYTAAGV